MPHSRETSLTRIRSMEPDWRKKVFRNSLWLTLGILLGRIAGFAREALIARTYGVSDNADIAVLALIMPDMMTGLLIGGGLSIALIPEFKKAASTAAGSVLFMQSSALVAAIFSVLVVFVLVFFQDVARVLVPGFSPHKQGSLAGVLAIALWSVPLTAMAGVSRAYLHSHNRFGIASMGTLLFNGIVVLGLVMIMQGYGGLPLLGAAVVAGAALRWFSQVAVAPVSWRQNRITGHRVLDRALLRRYVEAVSASGLLFLVPVITVAMASLLATGSVASMNYALKLVQLPLGLFITVLSVALFPVLAEMNADRNSSPERYREAVGESVTLVLLLSFAAMVPLVVLADDLVEAVYGWGSMSGSELKLLALLTATGLLSIPAQGVSSLMVVALGARNDTVRPLRINIMALVLFLISSYVGVRQEGLVGLMVAMLMFYFTVMAMQLYVLWRCHGMTVGTVLRYREIAVIVVVSGVVAAALAGAKNMFDLGAPGNVALGAVAGLLAIVLAAGASRSIRHQLRSLVR